jgi:hypothetical protein
MRSLVVAGAGLVTALAGFVGARSLMQGPTIRAVDEKTLREYEGVYQWDQNAFLYLQMWEEFSGFGRPQLVAFDESGDVRVLYPTDLDQFFTGPGVAVSTSVESRVAVQRDATGRITSLSWRREGAGPRTAKRVEIEKREYIHFRNNDIQLAGMLLSPTTAGKHPAIILVHGSGPENREYMLPFARFLIRHGMAVLGYDKRGVGGSTGDWSTASFDDLAGDVVAAFEYLKARGDIDAAQIGVLGVSQAGWIMPLAAMRAKDIAFIISISGAGVPAAETTIDQVQNEMLTTGMPRLTVEQVVGLMRLQYGFARTGKGWDEYAAARQELAARMGAPPPEKTFPDRPDHPYFESIRRLYFYDPGPTLHKLQTPTLAIWGELDNNIMAEKNKAVWDAALKAAGNRDYLLVILPKANHYQFEAKTGSNEEMASLRRVVPEYFTTISSWLTKRIKGLRPS